MRVLKFGGTSVADAGALRTVREIVARAAQEAPIVVVVSAPAGVSDDLITAVERALGGEDGWAGAFVAALGERCFGDLSPLLPAALRDELYRDSAVQLRELERLLNGIALLGEASPVIRDRVLAVGERLSVPRLTVVLRAYGLVATSCDAAELILSERRGEQVEVDFAATRQAAWARLGDLRRGEVVVVPGFLAGDGRGGTTILGRGASDYSATLLGAALAAERVEIWTDVDGVLSAPPRLVPEAVSLPSLSYGEASELAWLGARVLHPRTLSPVAAAGIRVVVRNTFSPDEPGTVIDPLPSGEEGVRGVTALPEVSSFELDLATSELGSRTFNVLEELGVRPLCFTVAVAAEGLAWAMPEGAARRVEDALRQAFAVELAAGGSLVRHDDLAAVALVGGPKTEVSRLAGDLLQVLRRSGIAVRDLSLPWRQRGADVPRTVLALIDRVELEKAVASLHEALVVPVTRPVAMRAVG